MIPHHPEEGNLALLIDRSKRTKKAGAESPSFGSAGSCEFGELSGSGEMTQQFERF
jgi:hypothetical protein